MADVIELMRERHSVRQYLDRPVEPEGRAALEACTAELNELSGLSIQVIWDEPECFASRMAKYGNFENANNYIALVGKKSADLSEKCGFYGEKLVLRAQELGLNTCWVALTHGRSRAAIGPGEKEVIIISLGYGKTPGKARKSKTPAEVANVDGNSPDWFRRGVEAALLAPTAVNQQKFRFERDGNTVSATHGLVGSCLNIDLGIVKCHFELAAGKENFEWKK